LRNNSLDLTHAASGWAVSLYSRMRYAQVSPVWTCWVSVHTVKMRYDGKDGDDILHCHYTALRTCVTGDGTSHANLGEPI